MRVTKTTLKKLIKEELDAMQGESNPFGSYKDKLRFKPTRPVEEYTAMANALIEEARKFYPKLVSMCDQDALQKETVGYLAYADQPGMGPNFRRGAEGVSDLHLGLFEAALKAQLLNFWRLL